MHSPSSRQVKIKFKSTCILDRQRIARYWKWCWHHKQKLTNEKRRWDPVRIWTCMCLQNAGQMLLITEPLEPLPLKQRIDGIYSKTQLNSQAGFLLGLLFNEYVYQTLSWTNTNISHCEYYPCSTVQAQGDTVITCFFEDGPALLLPLIIDPGSCHLSQQLQTLGIWRQCKLVDLEEHKTVTQLITLAIDLLQQLLVSSSHLHTHIFDNISDSVYSHVLLYICMTLKVDLSRAEVHW